ncbi:MAG: hypothetical protein B7Y90_11480 [Alphaproteobacteria bacterium 32-64-14]|nr:MAG: hypothetical protein B7Y90_11480 [Alphaproteobacteria bacterium 32-64-14]
MATMPNADFAVVEDGKLLAYILDPSHKDGWPKGLFLAAQGFNVLDVESVRDALLVHGRTNQVSETVQTAFGVKYRVDGPMRAPAGDVQVRTVWQIDTGQTAPRFVTMVPLPRRL